MCQGHSSDWKKPYQTPRKVPITTVTERDFLPVVCYGRGGPIEVERFRGMAQGRTPVESRNTYRLPSSVFSPLSSEVAIQRARSITIRR